MKNHKQSLENKIQEYLHQEKQDLFLAGLILSVVLGLYWVSFAVSNCQAKQTIQKVVIGRTDSRREDRRVEHAHHIPFGAIAAIKSSTQIWDSSLHLFTALI